MALSALFLLKVCTPNFLLYVRGPDSPGLLRDASAEEFRVSLVYMTVCLLATALVPFFCFHAYLVTANYTTIEFLEKRGCNPPPGHVNRYDLGSVYANVAAVLGTSPLLWLLPVRWCNEGDGLTFELNPEWVPEGVPDAKEAKEP